jgi:biopolymer transport protein ExbB
MSMKIRIPRLLMLAVLAFAAWSPLNALAQEATPAASPAPAAEHHKTLFEMIKEGGWVMFPIGLCSILTLYLIGDGVVRTSRNKALPPEHVEALRGFFRAGQYVEAYHYCKENPSPFTNVVRVGVSYIGDGKAIAEEGMLSEISKENSKLQTWISYLSVIGVCTPMIGLTGTVTGMIKAFATLGTSGIGDPSSLSAAIGEVLVATASGLIIAIPAFGSFYYLRNRAAGIIHDLQDAAGGLFRGLPYDRAAGVHIGDEELYAADPAWLNEPAPGEGDVQTA